MLLAFAAARELAGAVEGRLDGLLRSGLATLAGGRAGSLEELATRLGLAQRIARAGLAGRLEPRAVVAAKLAGVGLGAVVALGAAPALPARLAVPGFAAFLVAGFMAPDALLERRARRRRECFLAALPDALDMLAVGSASGKGTGELFGEIAAASAGPLAAELGATVAAIECGEPTADAITALRRRIPGAEVGALAAALERSRAYGSPLAEQLHLQASSLRRDAGRRIEERAARAAPKIQLVVALVLVPSVLLVILAAIVAHSDALLAGL